MCNDQSESQLNLTLLILVNSIHPAMPCLLIYPNIHWLIDEQYINLWATQTLQTS